MEKLDGLVGKFVNAYFYSDINPVGVVVGVKGKTIIVIKRVVATKQITKLEFMAGGFAGTCINQGNQEWVYEELEELVEMRVGNKFNKQYRIEDKPYKYYDYNF
jgi:hypothetical protein